MKRRTLFVTSVFCLSFFGATSFALANEPEADNVFTLGEIVVEESSGVQDIAISNTVTAEDIESIGAANAAEALEYVPGVNVVRTTKGEMNINIQGFSQRDVLVLIDGVPYYETKNGPLDLQQIPASIIGKIEVTKGASSVLYGPNALGGVVNIITKKGVEGFSGSVSAEGGRDGYNRETATLNYGAENGFSMLGTIDYRRRDALRYSSDYEPRASKVKGMGKKEYIVDEGGKKDNSDLESLNLWTRMGYAPTEEAEVYASLYRYEMERGRPFSDNHNKNFDADPTATPPKAAFSSFGRYETYEDMGVDLGGRVDVNNWLSLRAMTFYHNHKDEYASYDNWDMKNKVATSTWEDDSYGASLFSDMNLEKFGDLSLTAQYREDKHKDRGDDVAPYKNWEESKSNTFTLAAEETLTFGQFTGVVGLAYHRFDAEKIADLEGYDTDTFDPMVGLTWTGENGLELFGSVAKKTRFPTFADMESDGEMYKLDPEENINYTIGSKYVFFDTVSMSLSGFYNDVKDRIETVSVGGDRVPMNIDKAEIYGIELTTNTEISDRFTVDLDYVYIHARNESDDRESDYLEDVPEHTVMAGVSYMIPMIESRFSLKGTYKDDVLMDTGDDSFEDSLVFDLSLLKKWDNGFSLGGYIYNLFDADYYEGNGMACDGFNFKVVAQYEF